MSDGLYIQKRRKQIIASRVTGIALTMLVHAALVVFFFATGFTYLYPPPPEQQQLFIDFEEMEEKEPEQVWDGSQPQAEEASKEIELIQESQAQHVGSKANEAPEATVGDQGDVEVPEPVREKPIDKRALFSAANNKTEKDTLAAQTAREISDALKAGHPKGNTETGETQGEPKAKLAGRTLNGTLPIPKANFNKSGIVVVDIWVDQHGNVVQAKAGGEGTNVTDATLWNAARKAAMGANFNMSGDAPAMQKGTITYIFNITK